MENRDLLVCLTVLRKKKKSQPSLHQNLIEHETSLEIIQTKAKIGIENKRVDKERENEPDKQRGRDEV